nr:unnamed protein product [Callosobruchus chinensis]
MTTLPKADNPIIEHNDTVPAPKVNPVPAHLENSGPATTEEIIHPKPTAKPTTSTTHEPPTPPSTTTVSPNTTVAPKTTTPFTTTTPKTSTVTPTTPLLLTPL